MSKIMLFEGYCDLVLAWAKEQQVDLTPSYLANQALPFMREGGCVVEPHLRPLCTRHTCAINSLGFKPNAEAWTVKYFNLIEQINQLEAKAYEPLVVRD